MLQKMVTCKIKTTQYLMRSIGLFIMYLLPVVLHAQINIAFELKNQPIVFGVSRIEDAFKKSGQQVRKIDMAGANKNTTILIGLNEENKSLSLQKEGYEIAYKNKQLIISAIDAAGAMYGALDVAEQLR